MGVGVPDTYDEEDECTTGEVAQLLEQLYNLCNEKGIPMLTILAVKNSPEDSTRLRTARVSRLGDVPAPLIAAEIAVRNQAAGEVLLNAYLEEFCKTEGIPIKQSGKA